MVVRRWCIFKHYTKFLEFIKKLYYELFRIIYSFNFGSLCCGFAIQTDTVAINKCPNNSSKIKINWAWWMTGHVSMHGLIVFFITGNVLVAAAETIIHFYIDYLKCIGKFNLLIDQIFHILCKLIWVLFIISN